MTDILTNLKGYITAGAKTKADLKTQITADMTLTPAQRTLLNKVTGDSFERFDSNKDGELDSGEIDNFAKKAGAPNKLEEDDFKAEDEIDSDLLEYMGTPGNYFSSTDQYGYVTQPIKLAPFTVGPDDNRTTVQMFVGRNDQVH